jgi:multidrug efflux pump subunit AcrA (membrane-fusion protein)
MSALKKTLANSVGNELSVPAPCSGSVLRLAIRASGAVVQDGEVLGEVTCSDQRLQAELTLPQFGMARIKAGQLVKLLYDAFPYQRYGVQFGKVRLVSPETVKLGDTPVFRAWVEIQNEAITVGGQSRPLRPGMSGKAQIVVDRRLLVSYLVEPLRLLKESAEGDPGK